MNTRAFPISLLVDTQVRGVIVRAAGHSLMEEAPDRTIPALVEFLSPEHD